MTKQEFKIVDIANRVIAVGQAIERGDRFQGTIDLANTPSDLRDLFSQWEMAVNDQLFTRVDELDSEVDALGLRMVFERAEPLRLHDLQVYPSNGAVSFRLVEVPATMAGSA